MLLRQTLLYLPAQTLVPLSQMVAAFIWTFWLGPEPMGTYAIVWSVQELTYLLVLSWWSTYCLRYANGLVHQGKDAALDRTEMAIQLSGGVIQAIAAMAAVWMFVPENLGPGIFIATLAFTLTRNLSTHFATRSRAQMEVLPYTLNLLTGSVIGLGLGLIAVTYISPTPEALLFAYALAQGVGLAASFAYSRVTWRWPAFDREIMTAAWNFGGPLMLSSSLSWVGNHAIRFIVEFGLGRAAVGLMTVGWWMGLRAATFVGLLMMGAAFNVAVERLRTDGAAAALQQLATNAALLLGVLIPAVAGIWIVGDSLVALLVAPTYRETTANILPIAMAAGAARVLREHAADTAFLIFERPTLPAINAGLEAVATILFCSLGIWWGGVLGAAWGCLLAAVLATCASMLMARATCGYYIRVSDIARISVATGVMTGALLWLPQNLSILSLILAIAGGGALYGAALGAAYPAVTMRYARRVRENVARLLSAA